MQSLIFKIFYVAFYQECCIITFGIKTVVNNFTNADVAELVDALDLGSSISDVRVRVSPSALKS